MPLTFELDPSITRELRDGVCGVWADVSNAGGAVGFVPPVAPEDVRPDLLRHLVAMEDGRTRMLVGRDETGAVAATAFISLNAHRLKRHWCSVYSVMMHPSHQGKGYGRELMTAVEKAARAMDGIVGIWLSCRGGLGLERFYESCGYREVGRVPGAIKVSDTDFRDDVQLWLALA
jgi:GNAT superfamily N-acetyltransferase